MSKQIDGLRLAEGRAVIAILDGLEEAMNRAYVLADLLDGSCFEEIQRWGIVASDLIDNLNDIRHEAEALRRSIYESGEDDRPYIGKEIKL